MDWKRIYCACRRQCEKRGFTGDELMDRAQDAAAMVFVRLQRNPKTPIGLAIVYAAADAARGRTVHRVTSHGWIDAISPLDAGERARLDRAAAESFDRRDRMAQCDLDM